MSTGGNAARSPRIRSVVRDRCPLAVQRASAASSEHVLSRLWVHRLGSKRVRWASKGGLEAELQPRGRLSEMQLIQAVSKIDVRAHWASNLTFATTVHVDAGKPIITNKSVGFDICYMLSGP